MKTCLYIFHRDLRIVDNKGLLYAYKKFDKIIPIFIFDPCQVDTNPIKSDKCVQFMADCIRDLDKQLKGKLQLYHGTTIDVVNYICKENNIKDVIFNEDYTPFSRSRDKKIRTKYKSPIVEDYVLVPIIRDPILTKTKTHYKKFTPYYNVAKTVKIPKPDTTDISSKIANTTKDNKFKIDIKNIDKFYKKSEVIKGGREQALKMLKDMKNYENCRDFLYSNNSQLSAYLKFGCISIREVYERYKKNIPFIRQLFWRDFYYYIAYYSPTVLAGPIRCYNKKYCSINWKNNKEHFEKWKQGKTGFPIVDAGMRELNATGFMHNRARLNVASFLCKILMIDWQWGELYFAEKLRDYDPAINNGNWQWVSSSGVDSQPYFRIFNPFLQSKKHDPDCKYIKKWIPELKNVQNNHIHNWDKYHTNYKIYCKPIVGYENAKQYALNSYKKIF